MHYIKYENNKIVYENNVKNINNYHLPAHFIVLCNSSLVFTLQEWEKTCSTTSLLLIRKSGD